MITGTTTKLSQSTVVAADILSPKTDIVHIYGSEPVRKIMPNFGGGKSGMVCFINIGGGPVMFKERATGDPYLIAIQGDLTIPPMTAIWFIYSNQHTVWFASALYATQP